MVCSYTARRAGAARSGSPTARSRRRAAGSRASRPDVQTPFVRGPLRLAEAFALLPAVKRALPEATLPFERKGVLAGGRVSAYTARAVRGSRGLAAPGGSCSPALVSLAPAVLALRGGGPRRVPRRGAHLDRHLRARRRPSTKEHERCGDASRRAAARHDRGRQRARREGAAAAPRSPRRRPARSARSRRPSRSSRGWTATRGTRWRGRSAGPATSCRRGSRPPSRRPSSSRSPRRRSRPASSCAAEAEAAAA